MNDSEEFRRQCEAREWMRRTKGDPEKVKALLLRIAVRRGQPAADQLRQDMREAYRAARSGVDSGAGK
jgi:hypothetical protein